MNTSQSTTALAPFDEEKVEAFAGQVLSDAAATLASATAYVGHRAGLFKAMAGTGPLTVGQIAERTGAHSRYVREWLGAQAAGGYVEYDPAAETYQLPAEHAAVLADPTSPAYMSGGYDMMAAVWAAVDRLVKDVAVGAGVPWHAHDARLFAGTEEFFRPSYEAFLTSEWIPSLDGAEKKLESGARVADVGCGHGASTVLMARAYPASSFSGFDAHDASIATARQRAAAAGVADRVTFEAGLATDLPTDGYDLVCFFDALHDMGDPVGALVRAREALTADGAVMLIEPYAGDRLEDNLNPVGRLYYSASTFLCTANGIAQGNRPVLGAQAGEPALREVLSQAGFSRVRRTTETPVNMVLEARP